MYFTVLHSFCKLHFGSSYVGSQMSIQTIECTSKMQSNTEKTRINRMWQLGLRVNIFDTLGQYFWGAAVEKQVLCWYLGSISPTFYEQLFRQFPFAK